MKTFCFEARYRDFDGGGRCDIVIAPNRDAALKLAAYEVITDNCWDEDPERFTSYGSLIDWYHEELEILHEWGDLEGRACPNCTAHNHFDTGALLGHGTIFECSTCHYQWVPLGKKVTSEQIMDATKALAEVLAFEANMFTKENAA
ncbi:hypothetical protein ACQKOE_07380 [Novosphingobium sp. NPDC080210]|uniref:hypothetical protein n=1 Tax=Novosphingobium sp. NPDC080210 TaxID=3390596 RepID=UPI003CFF1DAF